MFCSTSANECDYCPNPNESRTQGVERYKPHTLSLTRLRCGTLPVAWNGSCEGQRERDEGWVWARGRPSHVRCDPLYDNPQNKKNQRDENCAYSGKVFWHLPRGFQAAEARKTEARKTAEARKTVAGGSDLINNKWSNLQKFSGTVGGPERGEIAGCWLLTTISIQRRFHRPHDSYLHHIFKKKFFIVRYHQPR